MYLPAYILHRLLLYLQLGVEQVLPVLFIKQCFFLLTDKFPFLVLQKKHNNPTDKYDQYQADHYCEDRKLGFPHIKLNVNIRYIISFNTVTISLYIIN